MPPTGYEPFLEMVLGNPADDGVRMVYADWLEERGDPRGEFVRVQLQLARTSPREPSFESLTDREMRLLNRHGDEWRAEIPEWARNGCEFRRGFVAEVTVWTRWRHGFGPELSRMAPIERVKLSDVACAMEDFAVGPELPHLRELAVLDDQMGPDDLKVLCRCPALRKLRALQFMGMKLTSTGTLILSLPQHSPYLRRLQHLELKRCAIDAVGVEMLAETENLPGLQWLDLSDNELGTDAFCYLVDSPLMTHLTRLTWNDNGVTNEAIRRLVASTGADLLTHLDLVGNHVGDPAARGLMERYPDLEWLDVANNALSSAMQYHLKQHYGERVHLGVPGE